MSSSQLYHIVFIVGAILAGIMLIITIMLFIKFNIPKIIGDLTGANARRGIRNLRESNKNSGGKTYKTSPINRERGQITAPIQESEGTTVLRNDATEVLAAADSSYPIQYMTDNRRKFEIEREIIYIFTEEEIKSA